MPYNVDENDCILCTEAILQAIISNLVQIYREKKSPENDDTI